MVKWVISSSRKCARCSTSASLSASRALYAREAPGAGDDDEAASCVSAARDDSSAYWRQWHEERDEERLVAHEDEREAERLAHREAEVAAVPGGRGA